MGFMASGKSTVGAQLARRLGWEFVDTDTIVERAHGVIEDIFGHEGEGRFRAYELDAVREALSSNGRCVIAVGGGAPTFPETRQLLAATAFRIFLFVTEGRVLERAQSDGTVRPLLGSVPTLEAIRNRYRERMPLYREAELIVEVGDLSPLEVATEIERQLRSAGIVS
jgi:shikimate kinase